VLFRGKLPAAPGYFYLKRGKEDYLVIETGKPSQCAMIELQQLPISSAGYIKWDAAIS